MRYLIILSISFFIALSSCVKDRVDPPKGNTAVGERKLIYYWSFNATSDTSLLKYPDTASAMAYLSYDVSYIDTVQPGSDDNARRNADAGGAIRMRNPYNAIVLHVPTTGFKQPLLTFCAQRSNSGPTANAISYSLDGINFTSAGMDATSITIGTTWAKYAIDFSSISGADNNPNFCIKLAATNNNTGTTGNDRYDNISIDALKN